MLFLSDFPILAESIGANYQLFLSCVQLRFSVLQLLILFISLSLLDILDLLLDSSHLFGFILLLVCLQTVLGVLQFLGNLLELILLLFLEFVFLVKIFLVLIQSSIEHMLEQVRFKDQGDRYVCTQLWNSEVMYFLVLDNVWNIDELLFLFLAFCWFFERQTERFSSHSFVHGKGFPNHQAFMRL